MSSQGTADLDRSGYEQSVAGKEIQIFYTKSNAISPWKLQAKKFVESAPTVVKADIGKDEAEKLKEALTKVGAVIEVA